MEYFVYICLTVHELTQKDVVNVHFTLRGLQASCLLEKSKILYTEHAQT